MPHHTPLSRRTVHLRAATGLASALLCAGLGWPLAALAERADRGKPLALESDKPCTANLQTQVSVCSGNVVISQGTLLLRAERLEVREVAGYITAQAFGADGAPARFRQKRDGVDEFVEGLANRITYDSRAGTVRFEGAAQVRRLRGSAVADEVQGAQILWNSLAEQLDVQGGQASSSNPGGRVRVVITPRADAEPAAPTSPTPAPALKPSGALGERR